MRLGVTTPLMVLGDSRFDQTVFRLQNPKALTLDRADAGQRPVFVIGSSWPADEKVLLAALHNLPPEKWQVIWAPHEVQESHLQDLEKAFNQRQWSYCRYSQLPAAAAWSQIILVDQVGILPELYALGNFAFVGGSFKDRVHSVMEPLTAGLPVLVGPYYQNNREAMAFAASHPGTMVVPVASAEELQAKLELWLQSPPEPAKIKAALAPSLGASLRILSQIQVPNLN